MVNKLSNKEVENMIEKRGLCDWDGVYINNATPLNCRCRTCNNECHPRYSDLGKGYKGCNTCRHERQKRSIKEIECLLEERGLCDWDGTYINNKSHLNCKCKTCGSNCSPTYNGLLKNGGCAVCGHKETAEKLKHNYEEINKLLEEKGLYDWDGIYANNRTSINCKCKLCNKKCSPKYSDLEQSVGGCSFCGHKAGGEKLKNTKEDVILLLEEGNLYDWDGIYVNSITPISCKCKICNSECHPSCANLQQGVGGCSVCGHKEGGEKIRNTTEDIKILLEEKNLYGWNEIYLGSSMPLICRCKICNSDCQPCYNSLQQGNGGCKACGQKKRMQTFINKYGVDNPTKNKEIRLRAAKSLNKTICLVHWFSKEEVVCQASYEVAVVDGYLNARKIDYIWQPQTFIMPDGHTYTPDLYLPDSDVFIEIKGHFWNDAEIKWNWFHKEHPNSELWNKEKLIEMGILKSGHKHKVAIADATPTTKNSGEKDDI